MTALPWGSELTVEDLEAIPEDGHRYELLDGSLLVTPAPNILHQRCVVRLGALFLAAADRELEVIVAPFDWVVGPRTLFQPDLLVARRDEVGPKRLERAPLLVVEVLSPSTRRFDLALKRMAYAEAGVAAYWLVDTEVPSLMVLDLEAGLYTEVTTVTGDTPYKPEWPFEATIVPSALVE
jgi:Uma2 family endonuclease